MDPRDVELGASPVSRLPPANGETEVSEPRAAEAGEHAEELTHPQGDPRSYGPPLLALEPPTATPAEREHAPPQPNPFWSAHAVDQFRLEQARPPELAAREAVLDGGPPGGQEEGLRIASEDYWAG